MDRQNASSTPKGGKPQGDDNKLILLLARARELDPEAWAGVLPDSMKFRRIASYKQATYEQSRKLTNETIAALK